jgi:ABC-type bacteriocin/lantibiotic exporter with double-glycine peptidase domain
VTTAVYALLFFGFVGYLIFKVMNKWAKQLGELQTDSLISGTQRIEQSIRNFRELYVQNKLNQLFDELEDIRNKYALRSANQLLIPNLNKYVLEISIAIGTFIMAAFQFSHNTAPIATANLAIFLVAGSRLAPAVMRVQHGLIQVKISMGEVSRTIRFVRHALNISEISDNYFPEEFRGTKFYPRVELRNLEFKYDDNHIFEVKIDELVVREGQSLAIVGKSGSGKTTLVDLMLGILSPKSGKILVSGLFPSQTFKLFPGLVSYVPQDIFLFRGSIAQNVSMEFDENNINYQRVKEALSSAQIEELASLSLDGLGLTIGEGGISLSGGQRQRIGIARALYSKPSLIFLDESTSALDAETEQRINDVISSLRGKATTITVAHRLSTVRNSDLVIYMENGKILGSGTFDELKESLPDFLQQTKLLGL